MIGFEIITLAGILAALWMLAGVIAVARMFPGYSHRDCVMSELGAVGRPSAKIHPFLNNFPLAVFYIVCGISISVSFWGNGAMQAIGSLIVVHGICHGVTGLFPCDEDLGIPKPSATQIIHNVAGLVMLLSLYVAGFFAVFSSSVVAPSWFSSFSLACLIVSLIFLLLMARSLSTGRNIGLHQRISYGALVLWVAVFSGIAYKYA